MHDQQRLHDRSLAGGGPAECRPRDRGVGGQDGCGACESGEHGAVRPDQPVDSGWFGCVAVTNSQALRQGTRTAGEVNQHSAPVRDDERELGRLPRRQPGPAVPQWTVDKFADEAAVQHDLPGQIKHRAIPFG